jgi:hypothetical protein
VNPENIKIKSEGLKAWALDEIEKNLKNRENLNSLKFKITARILMASIFWDKIIGAVHTDGFFIGTEDYNNALGNDNLDIMNTFSDAIIMFLGFVYRCWIYGLSGTIAVEIISETDKILKDNSILNVAIDLNYSLDDIVNKIKTIVKEQRTVRELDKKRLQDYQSRIEDIKIFEMFKGRRYSHKTRANILYPDKFKNTPIEITENTRKRYKKACNTIKNVLEENIGPYY